MKFLESYVKYGALVVIVLWSILGGIIIGENNAKTRQLRLATPSSQAQLSPSLSGGSVPTSVTIPTPPPSQGLPVQVEISE